MINLWSPFLPYILNCGPSACPQQRCDVVTWFTLLPPQTLRPPRPHHLIFLGLVCYVFPSFQLGISVQHLTDHG